MYATLAIAKREFQTLFSSTIAYAVLVGFLLLSGLLYFAFAFLQGDATMRAFFDVTPALLVVFVPAVTMRAIAEERKSGTLELLLSLPVEDWQVVLGKFLACLGMVAVGLAFTFPYAISVAALTADGIDFAWGPVVVGYLGVLLLASAYISLGLWGSALSRNQILGFMVGVALCFAFAVAAKLALFLPGALGGAVQYLSVYYHFENLAKGVIDTRDIVFYLSLTAFGLLLTTRSLALVRQ